MLQFIVGRASSGKSYTITEKIAECIEKGGSPYLLVPEQFSFESERAILSRFGEQKADKVKVISFTRLCDEVNRIYGGSAGKELSDADKIILMGRALKIARNDLRLWGKYTASAGFIEKMLNTVSEFKIHGISYDELLQVAENVGEASLKAKLMDTATVYKNFNLLLQEKFIDPNDKLNKLYEILNNNRFFEGKDVFIDSFKGFTGQQFKILGRIISTANSVTVGLTADTKAVRKGGVFSNTLNLKEKITLLAKNRNVTVLPDIELSASHYENGDLATLERFMAGYSDCGKLSCGGVTVCNATDISEEAEFVAKTIRKTVREEDAKFDDFAVIVRDTSAYEEELSNACGRNGVNCFIDGRMNLASLPVSVVSLNAAALAKKISSERIFRFYKSGLDFISLDELSQIENYTYLWSIDGDAWEKEWDMNPDGFKEGDPDKIAEKLSQINALREKMMAPIIAFRKEFCGNATKMSTALVNLLFSVKADKSSNRLSAKQTVENKAYAEGLRQSWDAFMSVLESISLCFGEGEISRKEFEDALKTALALTSVGITPQTLDEVTFGAADRIRPYRPKYVFIMGANQGVFPSVSTATGIFSNREREILKLNDIAIPDKAIEGAVDEEYLVYSSLCTASEKVFISYSESLADGSAAQPSAFVTDIEENLNPIKISAPSPLEIGLLPETKEAAFGEMCRRLGRDAGEALTLKNALSDEDMSLRAQSILGMAKPPENKISGETAKNLFGSKMYMSPTRFETFNSCRFMYFCKYGLKANRLEPVEFSVLQRGTLVHYVLERLITEFGKGVSRLTDEEIDLNVDRYVTEYLDDIPGYRSIENDRLKYLVSTISRSVKFVAKRLADEFAQSDFEPCHCELKIGADGDIPEIEIPLDDDASISLNGIVDRLDKWNGYIRIVDYKTGSKEFKFPDVLFGQNMQMLLYLYAVAKSEEFGGEPAGIFYMTAKRSKNEKSKRRMNGLMQADEELVRAMDKENKGEFVPALSSRNTSNFVSKGDFDRIFEFITRKLKASGNMMLSGDVNADPIDGVDGDACKYCDFSAICRKKYEEHRKVPRMSNMDVMSEIERQVAEDGI
ncbi:MAG: PD-(D/E)XK nuclease family protein [Clostridia bacterium]|nr:PD-(D/E)XK nuclease family protein [Clostridia bacterium]